MPIHNAEIAEVLNKYADLLEIEGANPYRIRAYRTAARNVADLPRSVVEIASRKEDLSKIPGLGKDLAAKVSELVNTGKLSQLEELKKRVPEELLEITRLEGLGPKRTGALYQRLGITSIAQLEQAAIRTEGENAAWLWCQVGAENPGRNCAQRRSRGWQEASDVLNTRKWADLSRLLRKKRDGR